MCDLYIALIDNKTIRCGSESVVVATAKRSVEATGKDVPIYKLSQVVSLHKEVRVASIGEALSE